MAQDTFDDAIRVRTDEVKQIITDVYSSTITFQGRSRVNALTSEAIWQIKRTYTSGNITKVDFANDGLYNCIWDDRFSSFNNPFFVNARSLSLDGVNDYLVIPHSSRINFERTDSFTFSKWVKPTSVVPMSLIYKRDTTANLRGYSIARLGTEVVVTLKSTAINLIQVTTTGANLALNTWANLIVSYDGSSTAAGVVVTLNGANISTTLNSDTLSTTILNSEEMYIGAINPGNSNNFSGSLDELSLFNKVLSSSEKLEIYGTGEPNDLSRHSALNNLVSWLRMGDGDEYPIIKDISDSTDATMVNMTRYDITDDVP